MNAKESRANRLGPYGGAAPEDGDDVSKRSAFLFSSWIGGGVNYWLLIVAIVLLIVIFGTPIVYRMLDESKKGEGPDTDSPAQEAISHGQRGKVSEKIIKKSTPVAESKDAVTQDETTPSESPETPITEKSDQGMGEASGPEGAASQSGTGETEQDLSEVTGIEPTPESDGVAQEKSSNQAAGITSAATQETLSEKTAETLAPEAKPRETSEETSPTTDETAPADEGGVSQPKATLEGDPKADATSSDIREVIVKMGNVRDGASTEAEVKFRIKRGETVTVVEEQGNWCAIELEDGRSGWAHHTLLSHGTKTAERMEAADGITLKKEIRAIRPVITKDGRTGVIFELNGYYPPETQVLDGGQPRLVCDFPNTRISGNIPRSREVENGYIERIRIGIHDDPQPKVRVVMDFKPGADYTVEQLFYKNENYYTLMVQPRE